MSLTAFLTTADGVSLIVSHCFQSQSKHSFWTPISALIQDCQSAHQSPASPSPENLIVSVTERLIVSIESQRNWVSSFHYVHYVRTVQCVKYGQCNMLHLCNIGLLSVQYGQDGRRCSALPGCNTCHGLCDGMCHYLRGLWMCWSIRFCETVSLSHVESFIILVVLI